MRLLLLFTLFSFYFEKNSLFGADLYVKSDGGGSECSSKSPCASIHDANEQVEDYDTVYLNSEINAEENTISIYHKYKIRPQTSGSFVTLPVNSSGSVESYRGLFYVGDGLIIYDIKFSLGEGLYTPSFNLFKITDEGYLRVENCSFERAALEKDQENTPLRSSLFYYFPNGEREKSLNLISCNFTNIESEDSLIDGLNGGVSYCIFTNITKKNGNGAAISSQMNYIAVVGCTFDNCVCENGNGGAIYASYLDTLILGEYNDKKTTFVNCKAKKRAEEENSQSNQDEKPTVGYGGAVYLRLSEMDLLNLTKVEFESGGSNTADTDGNCLFVISYDLNELWTKNNVTFMGNVASNSTNYRWCFDSNYDPIYNLKEFYDGKFKDGPNTLYIKTGGSDTNDCSSADKACATGIYALSTVHFHSVDVRIVEKITLDEFDGIFGSITSVSSNSGTSEVRIEGGCISCGGEKSTVENLKFVLVRFDGEDVYPLSMSCKTNTLKNLVFSPEGSSKVSMDRVLHVEFGEITMSNCNFSNIESSHSSHSPIYLTGSSVTVSKCRFENIVNLVSEGGGLQIEVRGYYENEYEEDVDEEDLGEYIRSKLSVKDSTFKSCSAIEGAGLYLEIVDNPSSLTVSGNTFEGNTATNEEKLGYDLYVVCPYLPLVVTSSSFSYLKSKDDNDNSSYGCYGSGDDGCIDVNLVWLVKGLLNKKDLYFGDGGKIDGNCTNNGTDLCSTFLKLYTTYIFYNGSTIHIVKEMTLDMISSFGLVTQTVVGEGDDGTLVFGEGSGLSVALSSTFKDLNVRFNEGCSTYTSCFITLSSEEYEFSDVKFSCQNDNTLVNSKIFGLYSSTLTLSDCTFSKIYYSPSGYLFNPFSNYHRNSNNKSNGDDDEEEEKYPELYIKGCTFDKCQCKDGKGGALHITSSYYLHLRIGSGKATTFNGCSAEYGGAIYCSLGGSNDYVFEKLSFGTGSDNENKATKTHGSRILVESEYLEIIDFGSIFPSIKKESKVDHQYDGVFKFVEDETKQVCYNLIDIINGNAKTGSGDKYVGKGGSDEDRSCTNNGSDLCETFDHALEQTLFDVVNIKVVNEFESGPTVLRYKKVDISGENNNSKIITISDYLFQSCVSATIRDIAIFVNESSDGEIISTYSGSLTLSSVIFTVNSSLDYYPSLVSVEGDSYVVMDKCSISNVIRTGGESPIDAYIEEGGSLEIKGCEFINCKVANGNGGAMTVILYKGSFTVGKSGDKKSIFKGCAANYDPIYQYVIIWKENGNVYGEDGNGGAIYLGIKLEKPEKLRIGGVTFGGSGAGEKNEANCGYDVFLICYKVDIKDIATEDNFPYVSDMGDSYDGFLGIETDSEEIDIDDIDVINVAKTVRDSGGFPVWAIVLIVVLVVVVIVVVVVVIVIICVCRKKKGGSDNNEEMSGGTEKKESSSDTNKE